MSKPKARAKPDTPRFGIETLRQMAGDKVFARGARYFEDGQVEILEADGKRVLARVAGSEIYRSALQGAGAHFSGTCSCPAFSDHGFCKHLVATALAVNALEPGARIEAAGRFTRIRAYLCAQGVEALVARIMDLAEQDPALFEELEFAAALESADDTALTAAVRKAVTDATRIRGFIEYREAPAWARGVDRVLDRIAALVTQGRAGIALALLDHFFERMEKALGAIDDSDGHAGGLTTRGCDIHLEACRRAKPEPVNLARDLFARETESDWDFFHAASATYEDVLGVAGLAEYRRLAEEAWRGIKPRQRNARRSAEDHEYGMRSRLSAILERFAERDGDLDARIAIRAKDLSSPYAYLKIAELYVAHDRKDEALKWAEDGLWQFENDPDERLILFTADLYRGAGRHADVEKLLWQLFERAPKLETYGRLKAAAGPGGALAVRDRAVAVLKEQACGATKTRPPARGGSRSEILVQLLLLEGLLTDAWSVVRKEGCSAGLLEKLADASAESHPAEALAAYAVRVEQLVGLGGNSSYQDACRFIGRMGVIQDRLGESGVHAVWLDEIMARHKAKRNFIKLLKAQGGGQVPGR